MMKRTHRASRTIGASLFAILLFLGFADRASAQAHPAEIAPIDTQRAAQLDAAIPAILARHGVATAGVGVLRGGRLVWSGYYGEQAPGIPASRATLFNVASITKTVAAETILRLTAAGQLSLDEPMMSSWVDPDIRADPRHRALTPRMALSHRTGFPNWRGRDPLAFLAEPGSRFDYSGEGINYVVRFAEEKLRRDFRMLVRQNVFDPIGITGISVGSPDTWVAARLALPPHDPPDGTRLSPGCSTTGQFCLCRSDPRSICRRWTASDDMVATVEDYAAFLISVMHGEGLDGDLRIERFRPRPQQARGSWLIVDCQGAHASNCPRAEGWGLGWEVVDYGDRQLVSHGGADWGEVALAYFDTISRDGMVVFLNGRRPGAYRAMAETIRLLDPDSPMAPRYDRWAAQ